MYITAENYAVEVGTGSFSTSSYDIFIFGLKKNQYLIYKLNLKLSLKGCKKLIKY